LKTIESKGFWKIILSIIGGLAVLAFIGSLFWYIFWVSFVDKHEYGYRFNRFNGEISEVSHAGWVVANPFKYSVHAIDKRPYQVSISANARILNAKLVKFNPAGIKTFIEWHGRSAGDNTSNLTEILKCYAFDRDEGKDCPFLEVVNVLAPSQGMAVQAVGNTNSPVPADTTKLQEVKK